MDAERIVLEPVGDGKRWRVKAEGGDVEGHMRKLFDAEGDDAEGHMRRTTIDAEGDDAEGHMRRTTIAAEGDDAEGHLHRYFEIEPAGEENGEPVFRVMLGGEDVEGHRRR